MSRGFGAPGRDILKPKSRARKVDRDVRRSMAIPLLDTASSDNLDGPKIGPPKFVGYLVGRPDELGILSISWILPSPSARFEVGRLSSGTRQRIGARHAITQVRSPARWFPN